jgi:hypothetical protein
LPGTKKKKKKKKQKKQKKINKSLCVRVEAKFIFCSGFNDDSLRFFYKNKSIHTYVCVIHDFPLDGILLKYLLVITQSRYTITKPNGCAISLL